MVRLEHVLCIWACRPCVTSVDLPFCLKAVGNLQLLMTGDNVVIIVQASGKTMLV